MPIEASKRSASAFEHFEIGDEVILSEKPGDKGPHAASIRAARKHQPIAAPEE